MREQTAFHVWRGSIRRRRPDDHLCKTCWRYSATDVPWCGHWPCATPRLWNVVRRWREATDA